MKIHFRKKNRISCVFVNILQVMRHFQGKFKSGVDYLNSHNEQGSKVKSQSKQIFHNEFVSRHNELASLEPGA